MSLRRDQSDRAEKARFSYRNSILVKKGYKAETRMSTRTGEIGTYLNARRKKGGERRKDKEGEKIEKGGSGEREKEILHGIARARVPLGA